MTEERFSKRYGFEEIEPAEITSCYEAPDGLRNVIPILAKEVGMTPKPQRKIVCQVPTKETRGQVSQSV